MLQRKPRHNRYHYPRITSPNRPRRQAQGSLVGGVEAYRAVAVPLLPWLAPVDLAIAVGPLPLPLAGLVVEVAGPLAGAPGGAGDDLTARLDATARVVEHDGLHHCRGHRWGSDRVATLAAGGQEQHDAEEAT